MSIQNNTAVDVYQDFILPTALDSDFSSEDLADDMDGLQMTMQRVKIPGGGNLQFEIRGDDPDNPDYERKLVGVILHHHFANAYWPDGSEYDDSVPPLCQSFDGKQGYGAPGGVCAACAFNQFGSTANGSGKACKNMRQVYLLRSSIREAVPTDLTPILKTAPIRQIFCNGATSYQLYCRHQQKLTGREAVKLPSTSPANAAWSIERLTQAWSVILDALD